jgi:DNA-binding IclR family transcriptional regulator
MAERIPPNLRVVHLLEALAEAGRPLTPTELNGQLKWPKQTIHRLCQTMIENGLVERHDKRLQVTPRTMEMAASLSRLAVNRTICHQILVRIAQEVGETVNFVRPEKLGMIYVDRVETNWPFRIMLPVGTHVPFHCTASGKTYLASLPKLRRKQMIESLNLEAHTIQTHTTVEALEAELQAIRRNGFALDREEFYTGMVAIAVPVTDGAGRYFAALACHGPVQRFSLVDAEARKSLLLAASAEISASLFGTMSDD